MTAAVQPAFTVNESPDRISAVDRGGIEICGAFQADGQPHWQLFVNQRTGLRLHPRRRRFIGTGARHASREWVRVMANHYTEGIKQ